MSIDKLKEIVSNSNNIVFFGGAGVSTESNIPDFRSANGLYNETTKSSYSPEEMLSHSFFINHTEDFYNFYKSKMIYRDAKPNDAHISLAKLEQRGKLKAIITQNIDGLHQLAGSKEVLELHGSVHRNYCMSCGKFHSIEAIISSNGIPRCSECNGILKPDVVLYEEGLNSNVIEKAIDYISKSEVLIVGGTSLTVYPASGLIRYFAGKHLILINKSVTQYDNLAEIVINANIGETLKNIF
jgi:NAD-dependent deacetylase